MRVGQNPNKGAEADKLKPVVLAVVTHLPKGGSEYHTRRIEVIDACLRTMRQGARVEHSLAIWDNGSCDELRDYLQRAVKPDVLVLSQNVGKSSARTALFRMFSPTTVIAYSDDDMLFYDNWLQPQLDLLESFPNVAAVSGYPVRTSFRWGNEGTKAWARSCAQLDAGIFIPRAWEDDFARSIGRDPGVHKTYSENDIDYRIRYHGLTAYATAHHCQFVAKAGLVGKVLQFDGQALGDEKAFDIALDRLGLRLCTTQRLARHIGNVMDDQIKAELRTLGMTRS